MPVTGDVKAVDASQPGDSQVQVYAVAPRDGATPNEVVDGFLESMTSDDSDFRTTRQYLTKRASSDWKPGALTTVLASAPNRSDRPVHDSDRSTNEVTYTLTGEEVATVDGQNAYQPLAPTDYSQTLNLVRQKGPDGSEWRIDRVPDGLVLGQSDFKRLYRSVNKFYFATGRTEAQSTLVADPVYIRNRTDPATGMDTVTQAVRSLLRGPTDWLRPVVASRFPAGTGLRKGVTSLTPDDRNVLKVPLNKKVDGAGQRSCRMMASQVLFTLRDLTSARVEQVELQRSDGSALCVLGADQAEEYAPDGSSGGSDSQYFVDAKGHVERIPGSTRGSGEPQPVAGPFGSGSLRVSAVGVSRDEQSAAALSQNKDALYTASLATAGELGPPVVTSRADKAGDRLTAPSWDSRGDLWVADRDPDNPRLLRLADGTGKPEEVTVPILDGSRITALRLSSDGVRIALLLTLGDRTTLQIGRIERQGPQGKEQVSVVDLRHAAPQLADVTAMSWSGGSRLVVVGKEEGGVQQVRYVQADGSTPSSGVLPGVNQVRAIAAADDEQLPLMADTVGDGIVKLLPGDNWQTVLKEGSALVYPG
ncbi:LpqB family beta-propeller domain-containing protein [Streptomyces poriferorum]|uniref:LpqB family beta-propeller domain-containing protein n=1 Tax=Streptomyces poriferorum TaxID=2798799 RepID=A0ABY9J2K7_9ACTN|nr:MULTISPECIES: LpqB family beta-propeller domain-containing protein [unclassified Streptomyces]MDP5312296.1 LpqB family beta-propeller domain-containing protein [Streptomyces sp. Alt4]WLQ61815.1 LpqB family beta-propeller domain-containing protein [Streptomyces sp. Alt2]